MTDKTRARFAEVVRAEPVDVGLACLLIGAEVEPDLDLAGAMAELDRLASSVDRSKPPVDGLRSVLGGFSGDAIDFQYLRASLLHEVIARRSGLPIMLSVVWVEVARRCGIAAEGIGLPGHYVVRVGEVYVDPFAGGTPIDVTGVPAELLVPATAHETLMRIISNILSWAGPEGRRDVQLWAIELGLLLPHRPVLWRHDLGRLLVNKGDFLGGAMEMELYAEAVREADPDVAEAALREARHARARLN